MKNYPARTIAALSVALVLANQPLVASAEPSSPFESALLNAHSDLFSPISVDEVEKQRQQNQTA